jgi:hypothetical protein
MKLIKNTAMSGHNVSNCISDEMMFDSPHFIAGKFPKSESVRDM